MQPDRSPRAQRKRPCPTAAANAGGLTADDMQGEVIPHLLDAPASAPSLSMPAPPGTGYDGDYLGRPHQTFGVPGSSSSPRNPVLPASLIIACVPAAAAVHPAHEPPTGLSSVPRHVYARSSSSSSPQQARRHQSVMQQEKGAGTDRLQWMQQQWQADAAATQPDPPAPDAAASAPTPASMQPQPQLKSFPHLHAIHPSAQQLQQALKALDRPVEQPPPHGPATAALQHQHEQSSTSFQLRPFTRSAAPSISNSMGQFLAGPAIVQQPTHLLQLQDMLTYDIGADMDDPHPPGQYVAAAADDDAPNEPVPGHNLRQQHQQQLGSAPQQVSYGRQLAAATGTAAADTRLLSCTGSILAAALQSSRNAAEQEKLSQQLGTLSSPAAAAAAGGGGSALQQLPWFPIHHSPVTLLGSAAVTPGQQAREGHVQQVQVVAADLAARPVHPNCNQGLDGEWLKKIDPVYTRTGPFTTNHDLMQQEDDGSSLQVSGSSAGMQDVGDAAHEQVNSIQQAQLIWQQHTGGVEQTGPFLHGPSELAGPLQAQQLLQQQEQQQLGSDGFLVGVRGKQESEKPIAAGSRLFGEATLQRSQQQQHSCEGAAVVQQPHSQELPPAAYGGGFIPFKPGRQQQQQRSDTATRIRGYLENYDFMPDSVKFVTLDVDNASFISCGGFGEVFLCDLLVDGSRLPVVAKVAKNAADLELICREAGVLALLHGVDGMVGFYGMSLDHGLGSGAPALVCQYMDGGPVSRVLQNYFIDTQQIKYSDKMPAVEDLDVADYHVVVAACFALRSVIALFWLHSARVVHFDVKPDNLLLAKPPQYMSLFDLLRFPVKIADLGLSRVCAASIVSGTPKGTPSSMAPELLNNFAIVNMMLAGTIDRWNFAVEGVGGEVDIWSAGTTLWEYFTFCLHDPAAYMPDLTTPEGIARMATWDEQVEGRPLLPKPKHLDRAPHDMLWKIIERCRSRRPADRPTASELIDMLVEYLAAATGVPVAVLEQVLDSRRK